jgi:hypothetical protein
MPTAIIRQGSLYEPITLTASVATTAGFSLNIAAGGMLLLDSKSAAGTITISFYVKGDERFSDTYQLVDSSGAAITQTVTAAGQAFPLPDGLFAARFILPVVSSGTAVVRYATKG